MILGVVNGNSSGPGHPPWTLDALAEHAKSKGASALLSEDVLLFCAGLPEIPELALLRQRLREGGVREPVGWAKALRERRENARRQARADAIQTRATADGWRADLRIDPSNGRFRASLHNLMLILEHRYESRLTFDEMAAVPLLDGEPMEDSDLVTLRRALESDEDLEFSRADVNDAVLTISRRHRTHPVRAYLDGLSWDGVKRIGRVAAEYLGANDPLSKILLSRFFVGAVARAYEPGCKMDNCLVLCGPEFFRKSTFFRILGGSWFKDSRVDITDRKGMMLMHSAWLYEWPEIDRMLEKRDDSEVKAFVSQGDDSFVPPYGRGVVQLYRSSVTCGTTNKSKFITSVTGNRRWWVVAVTQTIDTARLRQERDQLWAEAVHYYREFVKAGGSEAGDANPFRYWLSGPEEARRAERNEEHLTASPDVEAVGAWLAGHPYTCPACHGTATGCPACTGTGKIERGPLSLDAGGREYVMQAEVLLGPLGVPLERHEANALRCTRVLARLGWVAGKRIRPNGRDGPKITPYYSPAPNPDADAAETGIPEAAEPPP